jgi:hypothetical protein
VRRAKTEERREQAQAGKASRANYNYNYNRSLGSRTGPWIRECRVAKTKQVKRKVRIKEHLLDTKVASTKRAGQLVMDRAPAGEDGRGHASLHGVVRVDLRTVSWYHARLDSARRPDSEEVLGNEAEGFRKR